MFMMKSNNMKYILNSNLMKNVTQKKREYSLMKTNSRVKSPSLLIYKARIQSMISIFSRIFAALAFVMFFYIVVISPIIHAYFFLTPIGTYHWASKEFLFVFFLAAHIFTQILHHSLKTK